MEVYAVLDAILAEGLERRFDRHARLAGIVRDWGRQHFALFAEEGFESVLYKRFGPTVAFGLGGVLTELRVLWTIQKPPGMMLDSRSCRIRS